MLFLSLSDLVCLYILVDRTEPFIEDKMLLRRLFRHKMRQIPVRDEEDIPVRKRFYDLHRICRCNADVRISFQFRRRIDITYDCHVLVFLSYPPDRLRICHMSHGTVRMDIRHEHCLVRIEHLGALSHK